MRRQGKFGSETLSSAKELLSWEVSLHMCHWFQDLRTLLTWISKWSIIPEWQVEPCSTVFYFCFLLSRCQCFKLFVVICENLRSILRCENNWKDLTWKVGGRHFSKFSKEIFWHLLSQKKLPWGIKQNQTIWKPALV